MLRGGVGVGGSMSDRGMGRRDGRIAGVFGGHGMCSVGQASKMAWEG